MYKVKFATSVKYKGKRHPAHTVFDAADEDIKSLVKAGATIIEKPKQPDNSDGGDKAEQGALPVTPEMTLAELTQFAEDNDIDLQGKTKKAEIYNIIVEAIKQ